MVKGAVNVLSAAGGAPSAGARHKGVGSGPAARAAPRRQRTRFNKLATDTVRGDLAAKEAWDRAKARREAEKELRARERELKAAHGARLRKLREKQRLNAERKKEAVLRGAGNSGIQVIKDTTKIRRWTKKAKKTLVTMPAEMLERVYGIKARR